LDARDAVQPLGSFNRGPFQVGTSDRPLRLDRQVANRGGDLAWEARLVPGAGRRRAEFSDRWAPARHGGLVW
jgi:hypothetical protein